MENMIRGKIRVKGRQRINIYIPHADGKPMSTPMLHLIFCPIVGDPRSVHMGVGRSACKTGNNQTGYYPCAAPTELWESTHMCRKHWSIP